MIAARKPCTLKLDFYLSPHFVVPFKDPTRKPAVRDLNTEQLKVTVILEHLVVVLKKALSKPHASNSCIFFFEIGFCVAQANLKLCI